MIVDSKASKKYIGILLFLFFPILHYAEHISPAAEVKYRAQFDQLLSSDIEDRVKFQQLIDCLTEIDPLESDLPKIYISKALTLLEASNDDFLKGILLEGLSHYYFALSQKDTAFVTYEKALVHFQKANSISRQMQLHETLSKYYVGNAGADKAYEHANQYITLSEQVNDRIGVGKGKMMIAQTFINFGRPREAIPYLQQALVIFQEEKKPKLVVKTHARIALAYFKSDDFIKALAQMDQTISFMQKEVDHFDKMDLIDQYLMRAQILSEYNKPEEAFKDLDRVDVILAGDHSIDPKTLKMINHRLDYKRATFNYEQKNYETARDILLKIINAPNAKYQPLYGSSIGTLSICYRDLGKLDSAYIYHIIYDQFNMHDIAANKVVNLHNIETKYETAKKEETILTQESKLSQQRTIGWFGFSAVVFLGLLLLQALKNSKIRKQANEELMRINSLLESKNEENELLLKEIHHRVKNNLQTISSLLSLQSETITDPNALDAVQESQNRVASMALIHQKLYQGDNLASIEMRDYFKAIGQSIIDSFGQKAEGVSLEVDMTMLELDVDTAIPIGLITNELITNSLKYAFKEKEDAKISISMKIDAQDKIQLSIADNGEFCDSKEKEKDEATGFGSLLIQLLTAQLGGQLERKTEAGTAVVLEFPINRAA